MLNILYEDNHIIVVIKEPRIPSQADKTKDADMLTIIKQYIKEGGKSCPLLTSSYAKAVR